MGNGSFLKWLIGSLIALLAAGSGIVALFNYFSPETHSPAGPPLAPVSFQIENGYDRIGQDYSDLHNASLEQCKEVCLQDAGCKAFSFHISARQCWLKMGVPLSNADRDYISGIKIPK